MSAETQTRLSRVTARSARKSRLFWIVVVAALVVIAGIGGWLIRGERGSRSTVDPEIEEQVIALLDVWHAAWNNTDGGAALDLFTEDGRFVNGDSGPDGFSGEELEAYIDNYGGLVSYGRSGDLLIHERPDSYHVAFKVKATEWGRDYFELHNIVDEDGTLKIRYVEGWSPLGWFRLSDDLPYRAKSSR